MQKASGGDAMPFLARKSGLPPTRIIRGRNGEVGIPIFANHHRARVHISMVCPCHSIERL
jgi:hypothetical protein